MEQACRTFIQLLDQGRFYEAHEVLEAYWFPRRKEITPMTLVLKGFINAAVALQLNHLGRKANARRVWRTYLKYRPLIPLCNERSFAEVEAYLEGCYERYLS